MTFVYKELLQFIKISIEGVKFEYEELVVKSLNFGRGANKINITCMFPVTPDMFIKDGADIVSRHA